MSEKGFTIAGIKESDKYFILLGYADPKNITIPDMENALKHGKIFTNPLVRQ